ncbi:rhomboid family intramembrane serine protease [Arcanobacterium phocisimile]|uniref:Rhomboid family intramembrane serine protease n=1 Tax=Arcanobacterium phocisimile TaxID=1302235 RepID=A0ABX7II95_9ACTO|nr:rhomboid family intramembrane serine protease [Arcanobacterium phocisimile]QRV02259.1 rhomboid family intramembrane serine protease [Arcanobacterium phocisimile]
MKNLNIPPVTATMSALCILATLMTYVLSNTFYDYAFIPVIADVEPWRYLTGAFLHGGVMHLGFNVLSLLFLGAELEPVMRKVSFAGLFLVSAVGGNAAVYLWALWTGQWNIAAVGASGAIFGLFGALVVLTHAIKSDPRGILVLLGINVVLAFTAPQISWQAHLGGFLTGLIFTAIWWQLRRRRQKEVNRGGW